MVAALAFALFLRNAWACDDAYITFRSVEQLFAGNGPRWNPQERVQVFSSPLWYGCLAVARVVSRDAFLNAIVVSGLLTAGTLVALRRAAGGPLPWAVAMLMLAASNAFFDFTSSGLENPLGYLLLTLLVADSFALASDAQTRSSRVWRVAIFAGLLMVTRHDLSLLALPPAAYAFAVYRRKLSGRTQRWFLAWLLGPILLWTLFSLFYYGAPFPNPAYAKLSTGIPVREFWVQGMKYLYVTLRYDPISAVAIVLGVAMMLARGGGAVRAVAVGVVVNLLYVVHIGGDFMQGRFLSYSVLVCVIGLVRTVTQLSALQSAGAAPEAAAVATAPGALAGALTWVVIGVAILVYAYAFPLTPVNAGPGFRSASPFPYGVANERGVYFTCTLKEWLKKNPGEVFPANHWALEGRALAASELCCDIRNSVGFFGYYAGTDKRILDLLAICDPLLARLPMMRGRDWRPGHFPRRVPRQYGPTYQDPDPHFLDKPVGEYYARVKLVTQGDLWSFERLKAVAGLNLGWYDWYLDQSAYYRR